MQLIVNLMLRVHPVVIRQQFLLWSQHALGNITGKVRMQDGTGIGSVNIKLYPDNNLDDYDPVAPIRSVNTVVSGIYSMVPSQGQ